MEGYARPALSCEPNCTRRRDYRLHNQLRGAGLLENNIIATTATAVYCKPEPALPMTASKSEKRHAASEPQ
eukprot:1467526-Lingulodinium_polyedra.AAC.1